VGVAADRERAYRDWVSLIKIKEKNDKKIAEAKKRITEDEKRIAKDKKEVAKDKKEVAKDKKEIAKDKKEIAKDKKEIAKDKKEIAKDEKELNKIRLQLEQRETALATKKKQTIDQGKLEKALSLTKKFMALGHSQEEAAEFAEIDANLLD
jgi:septal ring factor EnvC (AmiA/AmiB activator)